MFYNGGNQLSFSAEIFPVNETLYINGSFVTVSRPYQSSVAQADITDPTQQLTYSYTEFIWQEWSTNPAQVFRLSLIYPQATASNVFTVDFRYNATLQTQTLTVTAANSATINAPFSVTVPLSVMGSSDYNDGRVFGLDWRSTRLVIYDQGSAIVTIPTAYLPQLGLAQTALLH